MTGAWEADIAVKTFIFNLVQNSNDPRSNCLFDHTPSLYYIIIQLPSSFQWHWVILVSITGFQIFSIREFFHIDLFAKSKGSGKFLNNMPSLGDSAVPEWILAHSLRAVKMGSLSSQEKFFYLYWSSYELSEDHSLFKNYWDRIVLLE